MDALVRRPPPPPAHAHHGVTVDESNRRGSLRPRATRGDSRTIPPPSLLLLDILRRPPSARLRPSADPVLVNRFLCVVLSRPSTMADRAAEWLLGIAAVLLNPDGGERLGGTRASLKGQALQAAQGLKTRQLTVSMQSVEGAGQEDRFAYFTEKLGGLAAWENVGLLERLKGLVREYMDALGAQCQARDRASQREDRACCVVVCSKISGVWASYAWLVLFVCG